MKCIICGEEIDNGKLCHPHFKNKHGVSSLKDRLTLRFESMVGKNVFSKALKDYEEEKLCAQELQLIFGTSILDYLKMIGIKRTSKEERNTDRYKSKYLKAIQSKYGEGITNISQSKEIEGKKKKSYIKTYGSLEAYHSDRATKLSSGHAEWISVQENIDSLNETTRKSLKEKYGEGITNVSQIKEVRQASSKRQKEKFSNMSYEERLKQTEAGRAKICLGGNPYMDKEGSSKPEKKVRESVSELGYEHKNNVRLFSYSWDILIEDMKLLIEVNGDFWHGNPLFYKENDMFLKKKTVGQLWAKDARKKKTAEENGYRVVVIWENDINKRTKNELKNFVSEKINNENV